MPAVLSIVSDGVKLTLPLICIYRFGLISLSLRGIGAYYPGAGAQFFGSSGFRPVTHSVACQGLDGLTSQDTLHNVFHKVTQINHQSGSNSGARTKPPTTIHPPGGFNLRCSHHETTTTKKAPPMRVQIRVPARSVPTTRSITTQTSNYLSLRIFSMMLRMT